jgi:hypothetical protein
MATKWSRHAVALFVLQLRVKSVASIDWRSASALTVPPESMQNPGILLKLPTANEASAAGGNRPGYARTALNIATKGPGTRRNRA